MINVPSSIPLPEDVERAVEQAKNNITVMQVETTRLTKFKIQLEKDVTDLNTQKSVLEENVKSLQSQSNKLISDNTTLQESVKTSSQTLEDIKKQQSIISEEITSQRAYLSVKQASLKQDRDAFDKEKTDLMESVQNYQADKDELSKKKSFLQELLTKL